jgi:hypothetical protein
MPWEYALNVTSHICLFLRITFFFFPLHARLSFLGRYIQRRAPHYLSLSLLIIPMMPLRRPLYVDLRRRIHLFKGSSQ